MRRHYRMFIAVALGAALWALPVPAGVKPQGWRLLAIFAATIAGMVLQVMEAGAVVVLGLVAAMLTRAMTVQAVLGGFSNSIVWLIVSAFLFSQAVTATGLGRRLAYLFIRAFGHRTLGLGYALAASELVIAPAVPANTARAGGILFPIVSSIARVCGSLPKESPRLGAFLMLNQFHATIILSAMFLTATTTNPLVLALAMQTSGVTVSWSLWAAAALVPGVVSLLLAPWLLYRLHPPEMADSPEAAAEAHRQLTELGPMKRPEIALAIVVGCCLLLWTTTPLHGLDPTTVAFLGLAAMLLGRVLSWGEVIRTSGAWDAMLWFGGLISMADWLGRLGVTQWFAHAVASRVHGSWLWILIILSLAYFYAHYAFASMTAHVTAMYAPFLGVAVAAGAPALLATLVLGFFSTLNAAMTHYSTGPAPIYFGAGYVSQATWWKLGFLISVAHIVVWLGLGLPYWKLIGVW
ncbi:MAG TPA: DASS family sodium-coupled anion symporter [Bryobacterales bacterium]|nr:DASS family sodium-coupled anion symporter [Bryobacterales bacterium]